MNRRAFLKAAVVSVPFVSGCSRSNEQPPIPAELVSAAQIPGIPQAREWGDGPIGASRVAEVSDASPSPAAKDSSGQPFRVLAISGGGANAAFTAGVLSGWSQAGNRPSFDVVTGVSAGALAAPFALLGPARDSTLKSLFTGLAGADLVRERSRIVAFFSDSLASAEPLRRLIEQHFDAALMQEIAAEHRRGRRLFVGTTHVYAGRPMTWDLGAIAASGHAGALALLQQILLASSAVPILLPPVYIEVEANGRRYHEMHVDGGTTQQVFIAPSAVDWASLQKRAQGYGGLEFYVIRNGRVQSEYMLMPDRVVPLGEHAMHLLAQSQGVGDLYITYLQAKQLGAGYRAAWIGDEFQAPWTQWYDPPYVQALFEYGYRKSVQGNLWHEEPPGFVASGGLPR